MSQEPSALTRRDFAKAAMAAVAVPVLAPLAGCTSPSRIRAAPAPGPPAASPRLRRRRTRPRSSQPTPLARALAEAVRAQYGDRLTPEQMESVQRSISGTLRTAERLRQVPLPIATEPTFVYRVPGGAP